MKAIVACSASREALQATIEDQVFCHTIAERVARALSESGKLLLAGNGWQHR